MHLGVAFLPKSRRTVLPGIHEFSLSPSLTHLQWHTNRRALSAPTVQASSTVINKMARPSLNKEISAPLGSRGYSWGSDGKQQTARHRLSGKIHVTRASAGAVCPLPAACPACHRLPEIQRPRDGRTKRKSMAVAQAARRLQAGWPASRLFCS